MRVGIVTQPLYANYGGILQNYALQQVLKKMGHDPITLDYMPSLPFGRYLLYAGKHMLCHPFHRIKPYRPFLERPAIIDLFVRDNINLTKTIPDYTEKILQKNQINAIIVGSDQVWRYSYNSNHIRDMYLDFAQNHSCKRIAYGVSFGVEKWDYPESESAIIKELVKRFDAISVREKSGKSLCKGAFDVDAEIVLDPTLFLDSTDYERFCGNQGSAETPYLAAYILDHSEEKINYYKSFAKERNLMVKEMTVSDNSLSVQEWLTAIRNAAFVVTDSYHGTLFSILFRKQFFTMINKERGADRFITILDALGLQERLIYDLSSTASQKGEIDYLVVESVLKNLRRNSSSFLYMALQ